MDREYRLVVFGKVGCPKCKVLNQRIDALLKKPEWQTFEKQYCDVETIDGLVAFCNSECVNPQRIPAFVVARRDPGTGEFNLLANPRPDETDKLAKDARLYSYLGLQTDYSEQGRGLITPQMIASVMAQAVAG
jgi:hypothetical protein